MSLYSSIELRLNYQSNTGNHGARGRCRQCTASGVFVVFCAVLLFNLLFCAQRGGQGAEHVASPLPRGPCHIIARGLTTPAKSAIWLTPFVFLFPSASVAVSRAVRRPTAGLPSTDAFFLHGEYCGGWRTRREIETISTIIITAYVILGACALLL